MANLYTLQDHIEVIKTGNLDQKKQKLTPESIADVRSFIASERAKRTQGTNYSLEGQFHEWEDLIMKFEGEKQVITATAITGASAVRDTVPDNIPDKQVESLVVSKNLKELKATLEKEANSPMIVASLTQLLQSLETEKDPLARAMIMNMAWSRLSSQGYIMLIQRGSILLENPSNPQDAVALAATLNNHLSAKKFQLAEIQSAVMTGTGRFGSYVETQSANPKESSLIGYVQFLTETLKISLSKNPKIDEIAIQNHPTATPAEKAFLISYVSGGYAGYNAMPDVERKIALKKQDIELRSSTVFVATEKAVTNISDGGLQKEKIAMKQEGKTEELTLDTFMDNPTLAIAKYPWTSLTLLIGSIYQFGFMKTIGGLLVGMVGMKALNEIGTETGLGKQIKDGLKKGTQTARIEATKALEKAGKVADEAYDQGSAAVRDATKPAEKKETTPALTTFQKGLRDKLIANTSLSNDIDNLAKAPGSKFPGKLDDYLKFIESDLKDVPLSKLLPIDHKKSIFFDNFSTDFSTDSKLSGKMLKRVLREYLTGKPTLTGNGDKLGEKEKDDFLKQHNIAPADIQNKKLSDILESVHKVQISGVAQTPATPALSPIPSQTPAASPTNQKNTFKIGGVDKVPGNNVETSVNAPTFDAKGNPYKNQETKLKTDASGVVFAPIGSIVRLGSSIIQRQGVEHIEVEYAGEKFYVAITHLKP